MADEQRFHIEKSISIGHIFTTISIVFSMVWWASTVETRLAIHETRISEHASTQVRQEADAKFMRAEINASLDRLNEKMDRMMERK